MRKYNHILYKKELSESAVIIQALAVCAKTNKELAQKALRHFDSFKERYYQYKPEEEPYDGSRGTVKPQ